MNSGQSSNDKRKRKQQKRKRPASLNGHDNAVSNSNNSDGGTCTSRHGSAVLRYPSHLSFPDRDFLRNESPYQESFHVALETSYLGLAMDDPALISKERSPNKAINTATCTCSCLPLVETLQGMHQQEFFQADCTQPFGLNTKCAKTYVTRCLVGDPGTTYKYLGLRMFAHRWDRAAVPCNNSPLCQQIGFFKDQTLVPRTRHHLQELHKKRKQQYPLDRSRPEYNICLINRMDAANSQYKLEPSKKLDAIAVAWHADSSLEHYSNIAVYQVILENTDDHKKQPTCTTATNHPDWSLALRVVENAEGPHPEADLTPDPSIPPLSLSLPSGAAYYMLDDFNHHHQHAVLRNNHHNHHNKSDSSSSHEKGSKKKKKQQQQQQQQQQESLLSSQTSIRYSCTYRLLRPSHTVAEVLAQCQKACSAFHKRGPKIWRSEQLLLFHIESEWLRQFYIQGQHHYNMLWNNNWDKPMQQLWNYWQRLEQRTQQTIDLLQLAAQGKCLHVPAMTNTATMTSVGKAERKKRDKQRKAYSTIQELLTRQSTRSSTTKARTTDQTACDLLYQPLANLFQERATMRAHWKKREKDNVFTTVEARFRPLPWPVQYDSANSACSNNNDNNNSNSATSTMATSPLPEDLQHVSDRLVAFGKAFDTGLASNLPMSYEESNNHRSTQSTSTSKSTVGKVQRRPSNPLKVDNTDNSMHSQKTIRRHHKKRKPKNNAMIGSSKDKEINSSTATKKDKKKRRY